MSKNGQPAPALRRAMIFRFDDAGSEIEVMLEGREITVSRESNGEIRLTLAGAGLLHDAIEEIIGASPEDFREVVEPQPRKRTDVAGAILKAIRERPVPADEGQRVEFLLAHTGLERDQLVASLGRLLKTGKIAVNGDLLVTLPPNG